MLPMQAKNALPELLSTQKNPLKSLQCEDVKHVLGQNTRQNASSHKLYYYRAHTTALQDVFQKTPWRIPSL